MERERPKVAGIMHRRMCEDLVSRRARFAGERTLVFPCGTLFDSISSGKGGRV